MKTRKIERTRLVPHTLDGKTRMVPDEETIDVPLAPRDWDQIGINTVTSIVAIALLGCMAFSTASIGDLLSRVVPELAAYGAAALFDLAWIGCSIIEWLARYTPARATKARAGGYIALAVAMGAVASHGWTAGGVATGLVGAAASGLAKGLWAIVLDYQAAPLSRRDSAFFEQELSEAAVELARIPVRRRVIRARALVEGERRALEADCGSADPDQSGQGAADPDAEVIGIRPGVSAGLLRPHPAELFWLRQVFDRRAASGPRTSAASEKRPSGDRVNGRLTVRRGGATRSVPPGPTNPVQDRPGAVTTKDAVRIAWDSDIRDDEAVIRYVAKATGTAPSPDTVRRYLRSLRIGA